MLLLQYCGGHIASKISEELWTGEASQIARFSTSAWFVLVPWIYFWQESQLRIPALCSNAMGSNAVECRGGTETLLREVQLTSPFLQSEKQSTLQYGR
jgi:hypothetical protein